MFSPTSDQLSHRLLEDLVILWIYSLISVYSFCTLLLLNLSILNCFLIITFVPVDLSFNLRIAVTRWWSLPTSAPLLTFTSSNDLLHMMLIIRWSIWFLSLKLGEYHVSLWISLWGNIVPPTTRLLVEQNYMSLSPFSFIVPQPCFPIICS